MKVEVEVSLSDEDRDAIADAVVAKLKASATVVKEPKEPKAPKATAAAKAEEKKAEEAPKVTTDVVLGKFRSLAEKVGKDTAVALLKKHAETVSAIPAEKLPEVLAEIEAAMKGETTAAAPEQDPFA